MVAFVVRVETEDGNSVVAVGVTVVADVGCCFVDEDITVVDVSGVVGGR